MEKAGEGKAGGPAVGRPGFQTLPAPSQPCDLGQVNRAVCLLVLIPLSKKIEGAWPYRLQEPLQL